MTNSLREIKKILRQNTFLDESASHVLVCDSGGLGVDTVRGFFSSYDGTGNTKLSYISSNELTEIRTIINSTMNRENSLVTELIVNRALAGICATTQWKHIVVFTKDINTAAAQFINTILYAERLVNQDRQVLRIPVVNADDLTEESSFLGTSVGDILCEYLITLDKTVPYVTRNIKVVSNNPTITDIDELVNMECVSCRIKFLQNDRSWLYKEYYQDQVSCLCSVCRVSIQQLQEDSGLSTQSCIDSLQTVFHRVNTLLQKRLSVF